MITGHQPAQNTSKTETCNQPGGPQGAQESIWERWFSQKRKVSRPAYNFSQPEQNQKTHIHGHWMVHGPKGENSPSTSQVSSHAAWRSMGIQGLSLQWGSMLTMASKWKQGQGKESTRVPCFLIDSQKRETEMWRWETEQHSLCFLRDDLTVLQKTKQRGCRRDKAAEHLWRAEGQSALQSRLEG